MGAGELERRLGQRPGGRQLNAGAGPPCGEGAFTDRGAPGWGLIL